MTFPMIIILVFVVSLGVSTLVYPLALGYAKRHNIVDNPNARKLQRVPVPVMGGFVVYTGMLAGILLLYALVREPLLLWGLLGMTIMLVIGIWDDRKDLPVSFRFGVEIVVVIVFFLMTGVGIDNFHGFWGISELSTGLTVSLTLISGVGVINAVNLIDGVDGYSSGYGMMSSLLFALMFHSVWSQTMVCLAVIVAGALLPFFMHNVFGVRTKMFMGDGGTLMLGMMLVIFLFFGLSSKTKCDQLEDLNISLLALSFAIFNIPVFDTLRVMTMRIMRGKSPFRPDKTHMHHLFIDMGFSHLGAALSILLVNFLVVVLWFVSWKLGASIDVQTYVSVGLGILTTFFYKFMKTQQNGGPRDEEGYPQGTALWHWFCYLGQLSHREKGRIWRTLRWLMDSNFLTRLYVKLFR